LTGGGIDRSEVRALVSVTACTGPGKILKYGLSAVLLCNYMVDLMWQISIVFVQKTIFAPTGCPLSRLPAEKFWHVLLLCHGI